MKALDCLIVHPTTRIKTRSPTNVLTNVILPMGSIAIADYIDRNGFSTEIVHTGLEEMINPSFTIDALFKEYTPAVIGIDLHWYPHSYDALEIAKIAKNVYENVFVVLGGFTASCFAEEILQNFAYVDAIVKGDAEIPMLDLLNAFPSKILSNVPNLFYRENDSIKKSHKMYCPSQEQFDSFNFHRIALLRNWYKYLKLTHENDDLRQKLKRQGWLCVGRGCSVNCSYCGGGHNAQCLLTGRSTPLFRSQEKVIKTLKIFEEMKISCAYMDFDPYGRKTRDYYLKLFDLIRKEGVDISAQFLVWDVTSKAFLQEFKRTFNPLYSSITLSPESGSEPIRKLNKGFYYTNSELFTWLNHIKEMIPTELYFTSGLTGETVKHFGETIRLGKKIVAEYSNIIHIACNPIFLEPCSPRFLDPKKFGIVIKFPQFVDFYVTYKRFALGFPVSSRLGYETEYLSERDILNFANYFNNHVSVFNSPNSKK
jgi:radical SAM superfamily enzyme YgiQ (UPF0313 family)